MTNTGLSRAKPIKRVKRLSPWQIDTGDKSVGSKWDAIIGAFLIIRVPMPGFNFVLGDFAALLLVVLSLARKGNASRNLMTRYTIFAASLLIFLGLESLYNDSNFLNRITKLAILFALAGAIAFGKLSASKIVLAMTFGLGVNVPLYYFNLTPPSNYLGCLTGFLSDKNVSGLYYALIPLLASAFIAKPSSRVLLLIVGAVTTFLTLSRSSLSAYAFGLLWLTISKKSGLLTKLTFAVATVLAYQYFESNFSQAGIFADRVGSDILRARIDSAAISLASATPWFGRGLSTATVEVGQYNFFLHNSYVSLFIEGGLIFALAIIVGVSLITFRPFNRPPFKTTQISQQAMWLAVMLCALRLGEVFLTVPVAVLVGSALQLESRLDEQASFR